MKLAFERSTSIAAPGARVWTTMTDWEAAPRWMHGVDSMTVDGPTAPGTRVSFRSRGKIRHSEIAGVDHGRQVVLRAVQGPVTADYTYRLEPEGAGTRVHLTAACEIRGPMAVFGPLLRLAMQRTDAAQLEHLRGVVEEQG